MYSRGWVDSVPDPLLLSDKRYGLAATGQSSAVRRSYVLGHNSLMSMEVLAPPHYYYYYYYYY
jgi:hypothetical protein